MTIADSIYTKLFEQIYKRAEERFFEEVYSIDASKEYENIFESIYFQHLKEYKSLSFYTDLKNYKNLILNKSTRDAAVKDIVSKFCITKTFETDNNPNDVIYSFLKDVTDKYLKGGNDNFTREELKKCLFYVIPVIYKETGLGITPLDLKGRTDNFRTDYWKLGKNYKGALKLFLDSYFECKFKVPSDCSKMEQLKLYTDFKNTLEDMRQSKK